MKVRLLQNLNLNGVAYHAGEVADLPPPTAIACLRRGTAQRADLPPENRVELPPENRIEAPAHHRWWNPFGRRRGG